MSDLFVRLFGRIAQLEAQIGHLNRRVNSTLREARVLEVFDDGTAVVEGHGGKSKKIPWLQRAGSIRDWDPPAEGERVLMLSPNGDEGRALILPGGYSKQYGQPHNKLGESKRQIGDASDLFTGTQRVIESQLIILRGTVKIEGGGVTHNGVNIGDTHRHTDVFPGGGTSGTPT